MPIPFDSTPSSSSNGRRQYLFLSLLSLSNRPPVGCSSRSTAAFVSVRPSHDHSFSLIPSIHDDDFSPTTTSRRIEVLRTTTVIHGKRNSILAQNGRPRKAFDIHRISAHRRGLTTDDSSEKEEEEEDLNLLLRRRQPSRRLRTIGDHAATSTTIRIREGGSSEPRLRVQGRRPRATTTTMTTTRPLRISAGVAKGRRLESPPVYLRPMMGKVREAVFSTLTGFGLYDPTLVPKCHHLDVFAGSGSVGLESLSRGAFSCTFVDVSSDCCATITRNIQTCQFTSPCRQTQVVCADAIHALSDPNQLNIFKGQPTQQEDVLDNNNRQGYNIKSSWESSSRGNQNNESPFHLITICPPYEEVVYSDLLETVVNSQLVGPDTIVAVEYPVELGCLPHVIRRSREDHEGGMIGVRNRRYGRTVIAMYIVDPSGKFDSTAYSRPEEFVTLK